jgi:hypothetical protein
VLLDHPQRDVGAERRGVDRPLVDPERLPDELEVVRTDVLVHHGRQRHVGGQRRLHAVAQQLRELVVDPDRVELCRTCGQFVAPRVRSAATLTPMVDPDQVVVAEVLDRGIRTEQERLGVTQDLQHR